MVTEVIQAVFILTNPVGYFPGSEELQKAINMASLDLYIELRGNLAWYKTGLPMAAINFGQTQTTRDSLDELYKSVWVNGGAEFNIPNEIEGLVPDAVQIVECQSVKDGGYYPVTFLPDNQFLPMVQSNTFRPTEREPYGRLSGLGVLSYEILPQPIYGKARCLCIPNECAFTYTDINGPFPVVNVQTDLPWQPDKVNQLAIRAARYLGVETASASLVQGTQIVDKTL